MSRKAEPRKETPIATETHTTSFSFYTPSESPQVTVTTSYEYQPNGEAKFGAPIMLEQE
jgi:hypothetical protein